MEKSSKRVAVIMQRRALESRWQSEAWEPVGVLSDYEGEAAARLIVEEGATTQWLHPGFEIELRRDEADGYYMNMSTDQPSVFILWRMEQERAVPQYVTVSYAEAGRWMDAGERVDRVALPTELWSWVGGYVERNYKPEPKKKRRPQSFRKPQDRMA
ncbi:MAG TPA: DUF3305 domain-containing protein [Burkholderiales bacterium]|nr:DUF3305 domain-containing protein [Burkholderiales bacterium]